MTDPLSSWHDGVAKDAVVSFAHQVCGEGDTPPVPVAERVAVFDNDGTRAERALERAEKAGWTTVSIKDDWATVF